MTTINLPNYNAVINNLTVNGTLTGSIAPTGSANGLAYYNSSGNLTSNTDATVDSNGDITTTGIVTASALDINSNVLTVTSTGNLSTSGVSSLNGGIVVNQTANYNTNGLKLVQYGDTTRQGYIYMQNNELVIGSSSNSGLAINAGYGSIQMGAFQAEGSVEFQSAQNTNIYWANTGSWYNSALSTAGSLIQIPSLTYQDTSTASSGTNANTACVWSFNTPTLSASNTNVTTTTACTVYIGGAPIAGTNQTITNSYALYINSGNVNIGGSTGITLSGTNSASTLSTMHGRINVVIGGTTYYIPYYSS